MHTRLKDGTWKLMYDPVRVKGRFFSSGRRDTLRTVRPAGT